MPVHIDRVVLIVLCSWSAAPMHKARGFPTRFTMLWARCCCVVVLFVLQRLQAHPVNCVNGKEIFSPPFDITGQPVHYYPMDSIDNTARLEDYAGNAFLTAAQKPMTVVPEAQSRVGTSLYFNNDRFLSAGSRINSAIFRKSFTFVSL